MIAWLLPLASFVLILFFGKRMGSHGRYAGHVATGAIVTSAVLSFVALFGSWLPNHQLPEQAHHDTDHNSHPEENSHSDEAADHARANNQLPVQQVALALAADEHQAPQVEKPYYYGDWYTWAQFGTLDKPDKLKLTIGYYIDALTVLMFCMVGLIASCVHIYAMGYMHDELHDFTDPEVTLSNGSKLKRPGRYYRFFQYLSLFCFSMFGVVIAGNLAMIFVFWELVGICSYFLIGFYIERKSASNAANKAFIVNRVGDFGMLIGLMALWCSLGTFAFGDKQDDHGAVVRTEAGQIAEPGLFSQLRSQQNDYQLRPTESVIAEQTRIAPKLGAESSEPANTAGQWLLLVAGVGIFCGCVGKSAQFPLHVWLPDAMEGPTPVSALVHSATMVAAGVYLVGRFFPVFTPEVLLVIAYTGCITLLLAATIAITATDIKRVLAYSTVSQLGYMMLSLGLGGWVAGLFHLITHACFKGLLFLCSGSVIHGVHTNDMTEMGGLRKKMPVTAYTMLVGCLAIIGAGLPVVGIGLSGYYSKDAIIELAWHYAILNPTHSILKWAPIIGALITAFYMFRLWYMTFAGQPRNQQRYDHAHESPRVMTGPLVLLAILAISVGWTLPWGNLSVNGLLEQARPDGTLEASHGALLADLQIPNEHHSHAQAIKVPAGWAAFSTAAAGLLLATIIYLWRLLNPAEIRQAFPFRQLHSLLWNKWWFDELYWAVFVAPAMFLARQIARFDLGVLDWILHSMAALCRSGARLVGGFFDATVVDGTVDTFASGTWSLGLWLRKIQTGSLRQYVVFIVVATVLMFVVITRVQVYVASG